jgi:hypothetical protein
VSTLQQESSTFSCSYHMGRPLPTSRASKAYRSMLYAIIVFISFFLMLVFMTYNVRSCVHLNCGLCLLMAATGLFDLGNSRRSWYRTLPVFRIWLGRRRKGDGLSLKPSVRICNESPNCDSPHTETCHFHFPLRCLSTSVCSSQ